MYTQSFVTTEIPYKTLFMPFAFNSMDYHGSLSTAKDHKLVSALEGVSCIGFIALFAVALYLLNPQPTIWTVFGVISCLLAHKSHVELLRYRHAQQWINHQDALMQNTYNLYLPRA